MLVFVYFLFVFVCLFNVILFHFIHLFFTLFYFIMNLLSSAFINLFIFIHRLILIFIRLCINSFYKLVYLYLLFIPLDFHLFDVICFVFIHLFVHSFIYLFMYLFTLPMKAVLRYPVLGASEEFSRAS